MMRYVSSFIALAIFLFGGIASAQGLVSRYVAGDHYQVIDKPMEQPGDGKIHVVEFFLYSCPHCYHLEPEVKDWREQLADDVVFTRVPVLFGAAGRKYARLYYTVEALDVPDTMHADIFDAMHEQGRALRTESDMRSFMVAHGVEGARFDKVYGSDRISAQVRAAGQMMRRFRVRATPSFGVAGRYWVNGQLAGSNSAMFDVADYLIAQQRKKRSDDG